MAEAEVIVRPNTLALKIGPRARIFTAALVKRAEHALSKVSEMFGVWLQDDIARTEKAIAELEATGLVDAALRSARQLRSSGAAFGYPIIARIAGSLCELLDGAARAPRGLTLAHMDAIKVAAREGLRTDDDPVARATCAELEAKTRLHLAGPTG